MKLIFLFLIFLILFGCATTEETTDLRFKIEDLKREISIVRDESARKITRTNENLQMLFNKELEGIRKQLLDLSLSQDNYEEKLKQISGRLEELGFELETYKKDIKEAIKNLQDSIRNIRDFEKSLDERLRVLEEKVNAAKHEKIDFNTSYKEAFEAFQNARFAESVEKFSKFLSMFPDNPLSPNALFWMGESYMKIREYEKAISTFQELIEKYPKNERIPQAMLSQADAFFYINDKKSSAALLKRIPELFPNSEEARVATQKLRSLE